MPGILGELGILLLGDENIDFKISQPTEETNLALHHPPVGQSVQEEALGTDE